MAEPTATTALSSSTKLFGEFSFHLVEEFWVHVADVVLAVCGQVSVFPEPILAGLREFREQLTGDSKVAYCAAMAHGYELLRSEPEYAAAYQRFEKAHLSGFRPAQDDVDLFETHFRIWVADRSASAEDVVRTRDFALLMARSRKNPVADDLETAAVAQTDDASAFCSSFASTTGASQPVDVVAIVQPEQQAETAIKHLSETVPVSSSMSSDDDQKVEAQPGEHAPVLASTTLSSPAVPTVGCLWATDQEDPVCGEFTEQSSKLQLCGHHLLAFQELHRVYDA